MLAVVLGIRIGPGFPLAQEQSAVAAPRMSLHLHVHEEVHAPLSRCAASAQSGRGTMVSAAAERLTMYDGTASLFSWTTLPTGTPRAAATKAAR